MRRVPRFLPEGQAATLQPLLLLDVHREDGGSLSRRAVRLPRVSQGDESPCRRRGGAAAGLLRGEDKGPARQDGQGGGEGGGALRAVRGGKVGRLLPTVHRVHLRRLRSHSQKDKGFGGSRRGELGRPEKRRRKEYPTERVACRCVRGPRRANDPVLLRLPAPHLSRLHHHRAQRAQV